MVLKDAVDVFLFGPDNEVEYARLRRPERIYASKSFPMGLPQSRDYGQPTRCLRKVFDEPAESEDFSHLPDIERTRFIVDTTPGGRKQIQIEVTRQAGNIRCIEIQKVPTDPNATELQSILKLDREASERFILFARALEHIPVEGVTETIRVEDQVIRDIFANPGAVAGLYNRAPGRSRELMEDDPEATDVIALAHRKEIVEHFRRLLSEPDFFEQERQATPGRRKEAVWQRFLEQNPWILGIGLTGQLLTSWNNEKLEQTVAGFSVSGPGKRTDALLRTTGSIRSLVFAEIKHHLTDLLGAEYRTGCWAPSDELAGGVAQVQQTVHLASQQIGTALRDLDAEGAETGDATYLYRPRTFLIIGNTRELRGSGGGPIPQRVSSFELYRRNLYEPEILTFDELLARAE
ncbi:Shedu immune nuclease family protein [Pseudonocardia charpentierae]|uniref:Shedu immune nuclease family protein n=1 Tax=Pseudonocardia charpentierae TaxID=3075545 RepID=A0ABU2NF33_9PSEU|nr:Shedu immune nuclease family protein [Pseudonocardia sp. DSM 45834]MDT0351623.1 Shedu immune nuclease family protein [Pseudonocardia sp. DSM 45834]